MSDWKARGAPEPQARSESESDARARVQRMREAFDAGFAELPVEPPATEGLLAIRLRGHPFALRAGEIAGLVAGRKIIPLPERAGPFLGLAGYRGLLLPVWDLAGLVGYGGPGGGGRWLVLGQGAAPWAVAFDVFEGTHRVPAGAVVPLEEGTGLTPESCEFADATRPIIGLSRILATLRAEADNASLSAFPK